MKDNNCVQKIVLPFKNKKTGVFCKNSKKVVFYDFVFDIMTSSLKFFCKFKIIKIETICVQNLSIVAHSSNELEKGQIPLPPPKIGCTNTPPKIGLMWH